MWNKNQVETGGGKGCLELACPVNNFLVIIFPIIPPNWKSSWVPLAYPVHVGVIKIQLYVSVWVAEATKASFLWFLTYIIGLQKLENKHRADYRCLCQKNPSTLIPNADKPGTCSDKCNFLYLSPHKFSLLYKHPFIEGAETVNSTDVYQGFLHRRNFRVDEEDRYVTIDTMGKNLCHYGI